MNNQAKNLFERALETTMQFGVQKNPNAIMFKNAVIIKRNFKGTEQVITPKNGGRPFKKVGPRFVLVLTEDMLNALLESKGKCRYSMWQFDDENPDLNVFEVEVSIKMDSEKAPDIQLITRNNGQIKLEKLKSFNLGILDEPDSIDIERVDLVVNPYDPTNSGNFTLWLRQMKFVLREVVDDITADDEYWSDIQRQILNGELPEDIEDPNED